jgi:thiamine-monophosphate kinase
MLDEFDLIARIKARLSRADPRVRVGIGDDAAILAPIARGIATSVDTAVDGVHFDRRWLTFEDIGWRSYAAALSDLAAMNARPISGLLSLVLPPDLEDVSVLSIADGVAEAGDAFGAPVIGGNISSGRELSITSVVLGEEGERTTLRSGARVGDGVFVTGLVGAAALGQKLLAKHAPIDVFAARWRRPRPRFDLARAVASVATSAIDVSDGLAQDLGHICEASAVGALVEIDLLPVDPAAAEAARSIGEDASMLALGGGEDYELLFTASEAPPPDVATRIGSIVRGRGVRVLDRNGEEVAIALAGHRHRAGGSGA